MMYSFVDLSVRGAFDMINVQLVFVTRRGTTAYTNITNKDYYSTILTCSKLYKTTINLNAECISFRYRASKSFNSDALMPILRFLQCILQRFNTDDILKRTRLFPVYIITET